MKLTNLKIYPDDYHNLVTTLCSIIPKDKYKLIIGITRGGLIPAVHLSHYLGIPMDVKIPSDLVSNWKEILVVDDIVDTGQTLNNTQKLCDVACLFWRKEIARFEPTYWVRDAKNYWVDFPYERGGYVNG